jgi:outer membrane autotransporter protein
MAIQQLENVRLRLASLRQGQKAVTSENQVNNYHGPLYSTDNMIAQWPTEGTGGGASADSQSPGRLGLFISGNYGGGTHDATDLENGFDYTSMGLTGGMDYRTAGGWVIGGALGYALNDTSINNDGGSMDVTGTSLLAYASFYESTAWFVDAVVSYQKHDFDAVRNIVYTSNGTENSATADSETSSTLSAMSLGGGYEMFYKRGITANLLGNIDYLFSSIDGYQESNAGIYNLSIAGRDTEQLTSSFGVQATYALSQSWGVIIPQLDLAWKHEFIDDAETVRGTFVNDPSGATFEFNTNTLDSNYFTLSLGASTVWAGGSTAYIQLQNTLGKKNFSAYQLAIGVRIEL